MTNDEIIELTEWCDTLVDRTFVIREKFLNLPSGMMIPIDTIRAVEDIRFIKQKNAGLIEFSLLCFGDNKSITSTLEVPNYPWFYYSACVSADKETRDALRKQEREYYNICNKLKPVIEETIQQLRTHIGELWADHYH